MANKETNITMLLYQQIQQYLQGRISSGQLLKNGKLPSERELQDHFQSTRITVREALMRLEAEGIIYRQNRRGWFVCPPRLVWNPVHKVNFYELAASQGFEAATEVVDFVRQTAHGEVAEAFGHNEVAEAFGHNEANGAFALTRMRYLNGRPVMLEQIYLPVAVCPTLAEHDLTGSLTKIVAEYGGKVVDHEHSNIFVTTLSDEHAGHLLQNSGAPCLRILRKRYDAQKQLIDYNIEYWLHSAIEMEVEGY